MNIVFLAKFFSLSSYLLLLNLFIQSISQKLTFNLSFQTMVDPKKSAMLYILFFFFEAHDIQMDFLSHKKRNFDGTYNLCYISKKGPSGYTITVEDDIV